MTLSTVRSLTRKNIEQLYALMQEYPGTDEVKISFSNSSGIGTNVYATVKYTSTREHTIDITDYESW